MARSVSYRVHVNEIVNWHQTQAANATIFILKSYGPTSFLLQEDGDTKKYKVLIGDPHNCTCQDFKKEKDLCKHICWVLLKKYRLDRDDPLSWQLGLVEREVNDLVSGRAAHVQRAENQPKPTRVLNKNGVDGEKVDEDVSVRQRPISEEDVCPICQDPMLPSNIEPVTVSATLPVTYCRGGCGNSIHIRCMCVWVDHQKKKNNMGLQDQIACPVCRGEFATFSSFLNEVSHFRKFQSMDVSQKKKWRCHNCQQEFVGNPTVVYKCSVCPKVRLCENCFAGRAHIEHAFIFKRENSSTWLPAPAQRPLRGIFPDLLKKASAKGVILPAAPTSKISEIFSPSITIHRKDLDKISSWKLKKSHRLLEPGRQCRLCLMCYKIDDHVRRLPACSHIFHSVCLDPWLLKDTSGGRCPLCGVPVIFEKTESGKNANVGDEIQKRNAFGTLSMSSLVSKQIKLQPIVGSNSIPLNCLQDSFALSGTSLFSQPNFKESVSVRPSGSNLSANGKRNSFSNVMEITSKREMSAQEKDQGKQRNTQRVSLRHRPPSIPSRQNSSSTVPLHSSTNQPNRDPRIHLFVGSQAHFTTETTKQTENKSKITRPGRLGGNSQHGHLEQNIADFSPSSSIVPVTTTTSDNNLVNHSDGHNRIRNTSQQRQPNIPRSNSSCSTMSIQSTVPFRRRNSHNN